MATQQKCARLCGFKDEQGDDYPDWEKRLGKLYEKFQQKVFQSNGKTLGCHFTNAREIIELTQKSDMLITMAIIFC